MAQCLCEHMAKERGLAIDCDSAGLFAMDGGPASPQAEKVMENRGLSLAAHRSKPITSKLAEEADVVLCMTPEHQRVFRERFPMQAHKARTFDQAVSDPFGGSEASYEKTATQLEGLLSAFLRECF